MDIEAVFRFRPASCAGSVPTIEVDLRSPDRSVSTSAALSTGGLWVIADDCDSGMLWRAVFQGVLIESPDPTGRYASTFFIPPAVAAETIDDAALLDVSPAALG